MPPPRVTAFKPEQVWQQAREPMFWLDAALRVTWVNRAWEELTGQPAESVVGMASGSYGPSVAGEPADIAASLVPPPEVVAGQPAGTLTLFLHAGGARLWRRIEFWPFRDQGGLCWRFSARCETPDAPSSVPDSPAHQLRVSLMTLRDRLHQSFGIETLIGTGPAHQRLLEQVRLAGASTAPVLITGEPGTGKAAGGPHHPPGGQPAESAIRAAGLRGPSRRGSRAGAVRSLTAHRARGRETTLRPGRGRFPPDTRRWNEPGDRRHPCLAPRSSGQARRRARRTRSRDRHDHGRSRGRGQERAAAARALLQAEHPGSQASILCATAERTCPSWPSTYWSCVNQRTGLRCGRLLAPGRRGDSSLRLARQHRRADPRDRRGSWPGTRSLQARKWDAVH